MLAHEQAAGCRLSGFDLSALSFVVVQGFGAYTGAHTLDVVKGVFARLPDVRPAAVFRVHAAIVVTAGASYGHLRCRLWVAVDPRWPQRKEGDFWRDR